jgi:hypothetical protein
MTPNWSSRGQNLRAEHPDDPALFVEFKTTWFWTDYTGNQLEFVDLEPAAVAVNAFLSKAYNEKLNEEFKNVTRQPDN